MFNYIGILITTFLLKNYFKADGPVDQTRMIPDSAGLRELIPYTRLTWAIILGVIMIFIIDYLLKNTSFGFDLQAVGHSPAAAEYAGISADRILLITIITWPIVFAEGSEILPKIQIAPRSKTIGKSPFFDIIESDTKL